MHLGEIENNLKEKRAQNAARNIAVRIIYTLIIVLGPFAVRTVFIKQMGAEYSGLNSLFQTIISLLSVSEMGFGQVMTFFLFEPLATGNTEKVNSILNTMRKIYYVIGSVIIALGIVVSFFLPLLVKNNFIPEKEQCLFFFLYLLSGVLQYFLFLETYSLLNALQRQDVSWIISGICNLITYGFQIILIISLHSYYVYLILLVIQTVTVSLIRQFYVRVKYPQFKPKGSISAGDVVEIRRQTVSMFGHQLDTKLLDSIDNLFITRMLGLVAVTIYGNYFYVVTAVTMFSIIMFNTLGSAIGNAIVTESTESNLYRFKCVFWLNSCVVGWSTICMFCCYQDFMKIWMPKYMLDMVSVALFCVYFYVSQIRLSVRVFKNSAGLWYNDRWKPYISMIADLVMDLVFIRFFGIKGAIISSILCVALIESPWETFVLFKKYFKTGLKEYISTLLMYSALTVVLIFGESYITTHYFTGDTIISLILKILFCTIVTAGVYLIVFRKSEIFSTWLSTVRKVLLRR